MGKRNRDIILDEGESLTPRQIARLELIVSSLEDPRQDGVGQWWRLRRLDDYPPMMTATGVVGFVLLAIVIPLFPMAQALESLLLAVLAMWGMVGILALFMAWTIVLFGRMFVTMFVRIGES